MWCYACRCLYRLILLTTAPTCLGTQTVLTTSRQCLNGLTLTCTRIGFSYAICVEHSTGVAGMTTIDSINYLLHHPSDDKSPQISGKASLIRRENTVPETTRSISRREKIKAFREKCEKMQNSKTTMRLFRNLCVSQDHDLVYTIKHSQSKMKIGTADRVDEFRKVRVALTKEVNN